jgi:hypothetical protein
MPPLWVSIVIFVGFWLGSFLGMWLVTTGYGGFAFPAGFLAGALALHWLHRIEVAPDE